MAPDHLNQTGPGTRLRDIDTLRALACLALVSFHVVGNSPLSGMELPMDHALHRINATLVDMRMPLFSFLSGYVFVVVLPEATSGAWAMGRLAAKARRLLVPMATVAAVFWLARDMTGTPQQGFWSIFVLPYAHFWYLQATFLIMAAFVALIRITGGRARLAAGLLLIGGATLWIGLPRPALNLFSVADALRLSGFFAAGFLAASFWPRVDHALGRPLQRGIGIVMLGLALTIGFVLGQGLWMPGYPLRLICAIAIGLGTGLALLLIRPRITALAWLGPYSYAIYLFHVFFTAGSREGLVQLAPDLATGVVWALSLTAGLLGPIVVYRLVIRHPGLALLTLGLRDRRKVQRQNAPVSPGITVRSA